VISGGKHLAVMVMVVSVGVAEDAELVAVVILFAVGGGSAAVGGSATSSATAVAVVDCRPVFVSVVTLRVDCTL
jgi:hypothetical protein